MKKLKSFFLKKYSLLVEKGKGVTLPGFQGQPIYNVAVFFVSSMRSGTLSTRAAAIAFNFFVAIFPAIIFLFTLIPYIPVPNFQFELLEILRTVMPANAYGAIQETITDIVVNPRFGLLSFGFIATLYFSSNGINSIIKAFNATSKSTETRSGLQRRIASLWLFLIFTLLITLAIGMIIFSNYAFGYLLDNGLIDDGFVYYLLKLFEWTIIIALYFFAISFMYYFAPAKKMRWRFISAGGSFSTVLSIITSLLFSFYVNNFGQYNQLYGSIGTIIVMLLWLQLNSQILIIGYELNVSIQSAKKLQSEKPQ